MSEPASISSGIAARYATAVFELASETGTLDAVEADVDALSAMLADSADLRAMITSPVYSRAQQGDAITAIASAAGLSDLMTRTLSLMASNRRLFAMAPLLANLRARLADARGESTAEVHTAQAMTPEQETRLAETLSSKVGRRVKLKTIVDESLIGGLVVKVGSKMIDTSIRSRLASLQNAMKEVG